VEFVAHFFVVKPCNHGLPSAVSGFQQPAEYLGRGIPSRRLMLALSGGGGFGWLAQGSISLVCRQLF
jgi:hypothetical protein